MVTWKHCRKRIACFTEKSEASNYLDELYFPKGEDGDVEALSKEDCLFH